MLSIVPTRRRLESRSGAIRPMARHAPLNSSISAMSARISFVILSDDVLSVASIDSSNSTQLWFTIPRPFIHPFLSDYNCFVSVCMGHIDQSARPTRGGASRKSSRGRFIHPRHAPFPTRAARTWTTSLSTPWRLTWRAPSGFAALPIRSSQSGRMPSEPLVGSDRNRWSDVIGMRIDARPGRPNTE